MGSGERASIKNETTVGFAPPQDGVGPLGDLLHDGMIIPRGFGQKVLKTLFVSLGHHLLHPFHVLLERLEKTLQIAPNDLGNIACKRFEMRLIALCKLSQPLRKSNERIGVKELFFFISGSSVIGIYSNMITISNFKLNVKRIFCTFFEIKVTK